MLTGKCLYGYTLEQQKTGSDGDAAGIIPVASRMSLRSIF